MGPNAPPAQIGDGARREADPVEQAGPPVGTLEQEPDARHPRMGTSRWPLPGAHRPNFKSPYTAALSSAVLSFCGAGKLL
jgi:hypothetical protein